MNRLLNCCCADVEVLKCLCHPRIKCRAEDSIASASKHHSLNMARKLLILTDVKSNRNVNSVELTVGFTSNLL